MSTAGPADVVTRVAKDRDELVAQASRAELEGSPRVDLSLRTLDVVLAGSALVALSPVMAAIAVATRLTSGRPVLYRGERVGRYGVVFTMYKFRTLAPDAETRLGPYLGPELTRLTESELTPLGRVLRAMYLDELPQLINVVRGDMSLVGPRPVRPAFFDALREEIPQYWQRLVVRPGLTGFAQVRVDREHSWAEKLNHDLEYIADRSVGLYGAVILGTGVRVIGRVASSLTGRGAKGP
ncbi:MAG: sugar transferase [Actinomycetota bacterium]|nr:sugar transferase [Actinomycetota bacterium]